MKHTYIFIVASTLIPFQTMYSMEEIFSPISEHEELGNQLLTSPVGDQSQRRLSNSLTSPKRRVSAVSWLSDEDANALNTRGVGGDEPRPTLSPTQRRLSLPKPQPATALDCLKRIINATKNKLQLLRNLFDAFNTTQYPTKCLRTVELENIDQFNEIAEITADINAFIEEKETPENEVLPCSIKECNYLSNLIQAFTQAINAKALTILSAIATFKELDPQTIHEELELRVQGWHIFNHDRTRNDKIENTWLLYERIKAREAVVSEL